MRIDSESNYGHTTTIEQISGYNGNGTPYVALCEVVTLFSDYVEYTVQVDQAWCDLTDEDRCWWTEYLDAMHEADVRLQTSPSKVRRRAERLLDVNCDMEDWPARTIRAVKEAEKFFATSDFDDDNEGRYLAALASQEDPTVDEPALLDEDYSIEPEDEDDYDPRSYDPGSDGGSGS